MVKILRIYSDGGARGNPGPAATAFLVLTEKGETVKEQSSYIGVHTNNQAEYSALLKALEFAKAQNPEELTCYLDSELVVKQLNGDYSVKNSELKLLWAKAQKLKTVFKKIRFVYVPRTTFQIQRADELVNQTLDEQERNQTPILKANKPIENTPRKNMFVHASIRTSNIDRSIDFYSKFLCLTLQSRMEIKATNADIVFLRDKEGKGCTLELTFYRNQTKFAQPIYEERLFDHLGFEVADIEKTLGEMRKANVTISDEPFKLGPNGPTIAFVEDPDGTLIELIQR
jgi:lactoylglutathione lyase